MASAQSSSHVSAHSEAANFTPKMRTIALVVVSIAFVMDLLDSTIVNIAIPSIQTNLGASYSSIQWLIAGYALSFALLLVTGGRMGDVYGYKKMFMIGVAGFTLASLLSGLAWSPLALIIARLLQGSMAALMVPQVMSLMQVMYKPEERGAINGLFGGLGGAAASLGPVIGGLLIKADIFNSDWRPIFLINVPIGIIGLVAAAKYLPSGKSNHPLKLDISGTVLIILAMTLLIYPLIEGRELDWPLWSLISMALSVPAFALFAWWQMRKQRLGKDPLVLPVLFKNRSFSIGLMINLVFEGAMIGFFLTFGLLLQIGFGFTPVHAALAGLPVAVGIALTMATIGEKVLPKLGRYAFSIGCTIMAIGLVATAIVAHRYGLSLHGWQLTAGLLVVGTGMGMVFGSLFGAVLNGVDQSHAGSASGTLNAVQQIGGAIGIAVVGVIFFGQLNHGAAASFEQVQPQLVKTLQAQHVPATAQPAIVTGVRNCYVDRSKEKDSTVVPESCKAMQTGKDGAAASSADKAIADAAMVASRQANADNFTTAFRWCIIYDLFLLAATSLLALLLPRRFNVAAEHAAQ